MARSAICVCCTDVAGRTTAGRPAAGTGSAEAATITRGGSDSTAGAAGAVAAGDWQYTDAPVRCAHSMLVLNRSHEQTVSCLSWEGDASPSALFDLARTRFKIVAQKYLY